MRRFLDLFFRRLASTPSQTRSSYDFIEKPYVLLYRNQFGCLIVAPLKLNEFDNLDDAVAVAVKLNAKLLTPVYVMQTVIMEKTCLEKTCL